MARISIYNEKGGVGKTTITAMLASYLAYAYGKSVCVLDFDYPAYHFMEMRRSELNIAADPKSPLSIWLRGNPSPVEPYEVSAFHRERAASIIRRMFSHIWGISFRRTSITSSMTSLGVHHTKLNSVQI